MTDRPTPSLPSSPTTDQIERFAKFTAEQRFFWLVDTLTVCHQLATPEVRDRWRKYKEHK